MKKNNEMTYVDLLSYIEETNRCPGGKRTINKILSNVFLPEKPKILEIGSNTGFTSIEIAKLIDCEIIGIDVNENAVKKSLEILKQEHAIVKNRVKFQLGDASNLNFPDDYFDLVITGGANTFIEENSRKKAVEEYRRVLKPYGFLSITNLFYNKKVPQNLLDRLSDILGFKMMPWKRSYWLNLLLDSGLELYYYDETDMRSRSFNHLEKYVDNIINNSPKIQNEKLSSKFVSEIHKKWFNIMEVFNENHNYLSFMTVVMRNNIVEEQQEFFIENGTIDPYEVIHESKFWE